jgi:hypothetical protein
LFNVGLDLKDGIGEGEEGGWGDKVVLEAQSCFKTQYENVVLKYQKPFYSISKFFKPLSFL